MKLNPVTFLIFIVFLYPILKGFLKEFSSNDVKKGIRKIEKDISFIIALFAGSFFSRKIFIEHDRGLFKEIYKIIPKDITNYVNNNKIAIYLIVIPVSIFIIFKLLVIILNAISKISLFPVLDVIEKKIKNKNETFKRTLGSVFQLPRSIAYVLVLSFILNIYSDFNNDKNVNNYLQQSKLYNNVCSEVVIPITKSTIGKQLPTIINNSFKIETKDEKRSAPVVYYNGVTLEEGIKSNSKLDDFSRQLVSKQKNTLAKAKIIYVWVGKNIDYDSNKASAVMNNNFNEKSGAIATFEKRKGICFDYSCLYVAMCRANNIKVRLVTGYGFNGVRWVGHAWNQVFLPEEHRWINVDTTFYKGGNYFNSPKFNMDHKKTEIAGEW